MVWNNNSSFTGGRTYDNVTKVDQMMYLTSGNSSCDNKKFNKSLVTWNAAVLSSDAKKTYVGSCDYKNASVQFLEVHENQKKMES